VSVTLGSETGLEEMYGAPAAPGDNGASGARMRQALAAFSRVAAAKRSPGIDGLLHVVAREISELVGVERCSIHLRDEASDIFRGYVGQNCGASLDPDIKRSRAGVPADGMTRELLETRRPVIVSNAKDDPRTVKSTVRYWKIRSIMAVPMVFADEVVGVIFLDEENRPHVFTDEDADVAAAFADLSAAAVMNALNELELRSQLGVAQRQLKALRRATAVDERLTEVVLEGGPLQDLLDTLAEQLGKPCAVFSATGERLATALPECAAGDGIAPRLLEPEFANRPAVCEALAAHNGSRAYVVGPLPGAGVLHRHVVAPVLLAGEVWGRLVVMEHKTRFVGGDIVTVRRAAGLIALHVSSERKAIEADWNAGSSLASELISGCSDPALVRRRAERLGIRLDARRVVMLIGSRSGAEEDVPDFRSVAEAFRTAGPELTVHTAALSDAVVALVELPEGADPSAFATDSRSTFEEVLRLMPADNLVAGISTVHAGPDGCRVGYHEARQVVECIRRFASEGGPTMFTAEELGSGRVFLATSDGELVTSFAEQTLGGLVGDPSKGDLLTTLCSFFENMGSIRRSADCLGVHENTIRYRLTRIEELTGLAVMHDPDAQLRARLSLLALVLQGRLPPAA
jgi:sugar diacid utilization regulator